MWKLQGVLMHDRELQVEERITRDHEKARDDADKELEEILKKTKTKRAELRRVERELKTGYTKLSERERTRQEEERLQELAALLEIRDELDES